MKRLLSCSLFLALALSSSGCLKTRAQLREEGPEDSGGSHASKNPTQEAQPAPGQYAIDELKAELTRMTGRIEDLERAQAQGAKDTSNANKEDVKKLDGRIAELEQAQLAVLEAIKKLQNSAPPVDATDAFEKGKALFDAGDLSGAVEQFSSYLRNPKGRYVEEATFFRAEAYYSTKDYKKAIIDYSKFTEKFKASKRVPTALYKIGLSFEALGMKEDAHGFFAELVEKFPKTPEAKKAKPRLR